MRAGALGEDLGSLPGVRCPFSIRVSKRAASSAPLAIPISSGFMALFLIDGEVYDASHSAVALLHRSEECLDAETSRTSLVTDETAALHMVQDRVLSICFAARCS